MTRSNRSTRRWLAGLVLAGLAGGAATAEAQNATITGRVTSEQGTPLQATNVLIQELDISVGTNETGAYTITVPAARVAGQTVTLLARRVGFTPVERQITISAGSQTQNFTLATDVTRLSEVVVTGVAAATEQIKVPFAVARVDTTQMPVTGSTAVSQLQGKIPGANIVGGSGRPGEAPAVVLRGPTSINALGRGQGPLYIVDGVVLNGGTPDLNPNDIANIEVVKGAAAASLYGSRAGAGVINITTKNGRNADEGIRVGFRSEFGRSDIASEFDIANQTALAFDPTGMTYCAAVASGSSPCARYIDMNTERLRVNDVPSPVSLAPQPFMNDGGIGLNPGPYRLLNLYQSTPWPQTFSQVDQATKPDLWSNVNLDLTGKAANTAYFASVGYSKQAGAFEFLDGYRRTTGRLNLDQTWGERVTLRATSFFSVQEEDGNVQTGGTGFFRLSRQPAFIDQSARDAQGRLYVRSNPLNQGSQNDNPLQWLESYNNPAEGTRFLGSGQLNYNATDWLDFNGSFGYDRATGTTLFLLDRGFRTTLPSPLNLGFIQDNSSDVRSLNTSVGAVARPTLMSDLLTTFTASVGYAQENSVSQFGYGENLAVPGLETADAATLNRDIGSGRWETKGLSYSGTADFDYLDRYILNLSLRREGSSLSGAEQRWANFPRVAGAWIASREDWWPAPDALSLMKFRLAYGKAGVRPSRLAQYETFSVTSTGALAPQTLGNRDLRLEILSEVEAGTDMELFGRYGLSVTYAQSVSDDQILLVPLPASAGFPNQWQNAGQIENKTWEASLDVPLLQREDMNWSTRLIYSQNRATITRLDVLPYNTTGGVQGTEALYFVREGERLGTMYGRAFLTRCEQLPGAFAGQCGGPGSQFQTNDDGFIVWTGGQPLTAGITQNAWQAFLPAANSPFSTRASWGMPIILRDSTGGVQQVALGNGQPDFLAGLSTNFSWGKFSAFALLDGNFGREVFNEGYHWALGDFMTGTTDQSNDVETAKPLGYYYRAGVAPSGGSTGVGGLYDVLGASNHSTEDGTFMKLREVALSYNVGSIGGRGNWTVGLVGRNLFTFTGYRGYDPEVGQVGGTAPNQLNSIALNAVDYFSFPNLRTFTLQLATVF